jgi:hypothetical protein
MQERGGFSFDDSALLISKLINTFKFLLSNCIEFSIFALKVLECEKVSACAHFWVRPCARLSPD